MSSYLIEVLQDGVLTASEAALYTVPAGEVWVALNIDLGNTNAITQLVKLWSRPAATSRLIASISMPQDYTATLEGNLILEAGGTLRGLASNISSVSYVVNGYKITL